MSGRYRVPPELGGERADRIVAVLTDRSRAAARAALEAGTVTREGRPVRPAERLAAGDEITVDHVVPAAVLSPDPDVRFGVAFADAAVIVVDKPAGLVVHPGAGHRAGTLANGLLARFPELAALGEGRRWGIVHRLDRETSGLLMVGRTPEAFDALVAALRRREVTRVYRCLVGGTFDHATGTVEAPIGRDPRHPTRMAVTAGGRPARTHYRRLATWPEADVTLLEVRLETGRTHQIRVHLRSVGHPVIGDRVYGRSGPGDPGRTFLHAGRLVLPHPEDGRHVDLRSPLPADLCRALESLGPCREGPGAIAE